MLQDMLENPINHQLYIKLFDNDSAILLYHLLVNPDQYQGYRRRRIPFSIKQAVLKVLGLSELGDNTIAGHQTDSMPPVSMSLC